MQKYPVNILGIGLLPGLRAIAAAGLALVVSNKLSPEILPNVGWALFGAGSVAYLSLLGRVLWRNRSPKPLRRIYNPIGEAVC